MKWAAVLDTANHGIYRRLCSVAPIRGLENFSSFDLGLTPQALCFRLLRRLKEDRSDKEDQESHDRVADLLTTPPGDFFAEPFFPGFASSKALGLLMKVIG